jgi:hypothetical protein
MRIRSTKPEFWRSERVASVDWDARLVLKGLESFVDDNGVGKDDIALIVADVFPRDLSRNPPGTLRRVSEALSHLSGAGLLWRYEVKGEKLLYVAFWESIQRIEKPGKGRLPRPDGTMEYRESMIREDSGNPPGTLPEPSGLEQGNRGTGEQGNRSGGRPGNASTESYDHREILAAAGLNEDDARRFLIHLRSNGITKPPAFVKEYARAGKLKARIEEWIEECEAAANAPRVIQANVTKAKRVHGKANYDVEVCEAHGSEASTCPMCRAGSKEKSA